VLCIKKIINFCKICIKEKKNPVFITIKILLHETDEEAFGIKISQVILQFLNNSDAVKFEFGKNFLNDCSTIVENGLILTEYTLE